MSNLNKNKSSFTNSFRSVPMISKYNDCPATVENRFIDKVNIVATWLSLVGSPRRGYNGVTLSRSGSYIISNLEVVYEFQVKYDALSDLFVCSGVQNYYHVGNGSKAAKSQNLNFESSNYEDMYKFISYLFTKVVPYDLQK